MPRKKLIRTDRGFYHVTSRANHRFNFPIPIEESWNIFLNLIARVSKLLEARAHAFVLMSNHYHLLLTSPGKNIDEIMKVFNREFTRRVSLKTGLINHVFGARYSWGIAYDRSSVAHVLKYIFRNPVKAGIVQQVEDYQFSTVREFVGADTPSKFLHPIDGLDVKSAKGAGKGILNWLNSPLRKEQEEMIRKAIRKREFSFSNASRFRKEIEAIPKSPW